MQSQLFSVGVRVSVSVGDYEDDADVDEVDGQVPQELLHFLLNHLPGLEPVVEFRLQQPLRRLGFGSNALKRILALC